MQCSPKRRRGSERVEWWWIDNKDAVTRDGCRHGRSAISHDSNGNTLSLEETKLLQSIGL